MHQRIKWFKNHPQQEEIQKALDAKYTRVLVTKARELGFTWFATKWLSREAVKNEHECNICKGKCNGELGWVAPMSDQYQRAVEAFKYFIPQSIGRMNEYKKIFTFVTGETIQFFTCHNTPNVCMSHHFKKIVIDEAPIVPELQFWRTIYPSMGSHNCVMLAGGTSRGKATWHYQLRLSAEKGEPGFYHYDAGKSIYTVSDKFREEAARHMPEHLVRQELYGETLEDMASVFAGYNDCMNGEYLEKPESTAHHYVAGVDLGKHQDYTVILIGDAKEKRIVYKKRFKDIQWTDQVKIILDTLHTWNDAPTLVDATGLGDSVFDFMNQEKQKKGYSMELTPFVFTSVSKQSIIQELILAIQTQRISMPRDSEIEQELESFQYRYTSSRYLSYEASKGFHDDIIMAMALLNSQFNSLKINSLSLWDNIEFVEEDFHKELGNW